MAVNYGLRGAAHERALTLAPQLFGAALPPPCEPIEQGAFALEHWPPRRATRPEDLTASRCLIEIAAMPTFVSPLRWRVILRMPNAYELREIDLLDSRLTAANGPPAALQRSTLRVPNVWTAAVQRAAATKTAQAFLGFARFPAARAFTDSDGVSTVRWSDMRFAGGWLTLAQTGSRPQPFSVTVRVAPDGTILEERIER
jgi:hypothetical protein